jgi:hypothetical protein
MIFPVFFTFSLLMAQSSDCAQPSSSEVVLEKGHIHVVLSSQEAQEQYSNIYNDERRLKDRVFWSPQNNEYYYTAKGLTQLLPSEFIQNLQSQLLQALNQTYADFVYYADLGHLHLLLPHGQTELSFKSPNLLSLFHTGELYQFKENGSISGSLVSDPHWQWLYWHRNFVGANKFNTPLLPLRAPVDAIYNTVRTIEGYDEVGKVYFSANKNGCFELKNETVNLRFDISVVL